MLPLSRPQSSRVATQVPAASDESHEPVRIWWGNSPVHWEHETASPDIVPTFRFGGAAGTALWFLAGLVAPVHGATSSDVHLGTFVEDVLTRARRLDLPPVKVIATRYGSGFNVNPELTEATSAAVRTGDVEVHVPINVGWAATVDEFNEQLAASDCTAVGVFASTADRNALPVWREWMREDSRLIEPHAMSYPRPTHADLRRALASTSPTTFLAIDLAHAVCDDPGEGASMQCPPGLSKRRADLSTEKTLAPIHEAQSANMPTMLIVPDDLWIEYDHSFPPAIRHVASALACILAAPMDPNNNRLLACATVAAGFEAIWKSSGPDETDHTPEMRAAFEQHYEEQGFRIFDLPFDDGARRASVLISPELVPALAPISGAEPA